jgi:threonine-phosphate decarboxylase
MTVHGGDVWNLEFPASEILDFSANINPRGLPAAAQARLVQDAADSKLLRLYPDPSARALRMALGEYLGCAPEAILIGPGAESLLAPILRYLRPKRALVPVPAFSEYRRVCAQENVEFVPFPLLREENFQLSGGLGAFDFALINNPHNPTGCLFRTEAAASAIVDEAFIDYAPEHSMVREAAIRPGLIVLRSLTKFFGCPALRVGYAVSHPDTVKGIRELLPTWPVTQLAMDALIEALKDKTYAEETLKENALEREKLSHELGKLGLTVFPSMANFLFIELGSGMRCSSELRARMISHHKILIRNCDSYENLETGRYIRVAVRSREDNERLVAGLHEELS